MDARETVEPMSRPARRRLAWHPHARRRRRAGDRRGAAPVTRLFILEPERMVEEPLAAVSALPAGVDVLLRGYRMPARPVFARRLARLCRRQGRRLLIACDTELAAGPHADGLHLGEELARASAPRRGLPPARLLSVAVHSRRALARAMQVGADLVLLSPVFATRSHPGSPFLGPHRLARLIARPGAGTRRPRFLALGGIDPLTSRRLPPGIDGIAAIGGWLDEATKGRPSHP